MRHIRLGYILQIALVVAIILIAGGYQLPKYTSRLTMLAVLAAIDMLYWFSVKKAITPRYKRILKIAYWVPLFTLLMFFLCGLLLPYTQWPTLFRIYFPGILLILLFGKGIFLSLLVVSDVFIIPINLIKRVDPEAAGKPIGWYRPRTFLLSSAALASSVMLIFILGMFFWVYDYKLNVVEIPVKNLPESFDGYSIVQLSDLHLGGFVSAKPINKILKIVNEQNPDLIVFTGDLVSFTTYEAYPYENELMQFKATDGVYAILGNHDYGEYSHWDSEEAKELNDVALYEFYKQVGWHLLRNENALIRRDSASIAIIGVENWSNNKRFGKKGDIRKALIGADSSSYNILLTHDPSHWDAEVTELFPQIGLTLSGHTHAFQVAIETRSRKWSPASRLFKEWAGLYEKVQHNGVNQYLYVNRGAGTLGYPGRIFTRPEITLLILRSTN